MDLGDADLFPIRVLGEGTFGKVFLCQTRSEKNRRQVCVKRIIIQNPKLEMHMVQEEVYIISQLQHPRIVKFIRSFVHAGTVNIVLEYINNGTIRNVIDRARLNGHALKKQKLLNFFLDMLMGLEYLHIRNVTHRDIKPENLLLDQHERIKYADFGISGIHHHSACKQTIKSAGTPIYSAPEILRNERYDFKSDIWSLGCVLYEMCMCEHPFHMATNIENLRYIMRVLTRPNLTFSARMPEMYGAILSTICKRMICYDLQHRISLPALIAIDPLITIPYYQRYFEYDY